MNDAKVSINYRFWIDVPFDIIAQMSERGPHPVSCFTHHIQFNPPKKVDN